MSGATEKGRHLLEEVDYEFKPSIEPCLLCGDPVGCFDEDGSIVKQESGQGENQNLFECLCTALEFPKYSNLRKDWDFEEEPLPFCGSCKMLTTSLAEVYTKLEELKKRVLEILKAGENKYLEEDLYHSRDSRYSAFRKQALGGVQASNPGDEQRQQNAEATNSRSKARPILQKPSGTTLQPILPKPVPLATDFRPILPKPSGMGLVTEYIIVTVPPPPPVSIPTNILQSIPQQKEVIDLFMEEENEEEVIIAPSPKQEIADDGDPLASISFSEEPQCSSYMLRPRRSPQKRHSEMKLTAEESFPSSSSSEDEDVHPAKKHKIRARSLLSRRNRGRLSLWSKAATGKTSGSNLSFPPTATQPWQRGRIVVDPATRNITFSSGQGRAFHSLLFEKVDGKGVRASHYYNCSLCSKRVDFEPNCRLQLKSFRKHWSQFHSIFNRCKLCLGPPFPSKHLLVKHLRTEHNISSFNQMNYKRKRRGINLDSHQIIRTEKTREECEVCGMPFHTYLHQSYVDHLLTHMNVEERNAASRKVEAELERDPLPAKQNENLWSTIASGQVAKSTLTTFNPRKTTEWVAQAGTMTHDPATGNITYTTGHGNGLASTRSNLIFEKMEGIGDNACHYYQCSLCRGRVNFEKSCRTQVKKFRIHWLQIHSTRNRCKLCIGPPFPTSNDLLQHLKAEHDMDSISKMHWTYLDKTNEGRLCHNLSLKLKRSNCEVCGMPFELYHHYAYVDHVLSHMSEEERSTAKEEVKAQFSSNMEVTSSNRKTRKRTQKPGEGATREPRKTGAPTTEEIASGSVIQCQLCGKLYRGGRAGLMMHMKKAHEKQDNLGQVPSPFLCTVCGHLFSRKTNLHTHITKCHSSTVEPLKPCMYPECDKKFITDEELQAHVLPEHAGSEQDEKGLMCKLCGRCFAVAWSYRTHAVVHTKERNYKCHVCNLAYPLKATLMWHIAAQHGVEKFHCDVEGCDRVFRSKKQVGAHMRYAHQVYANKQHKNTQDELEKGKG